MANEDDDQQSRGLHKPFGRRSFIKGAVAGTGIAVTDISVLSKIGGASSPRVSNENALPGSTGWDINADDSIEGFAHRWSVNAGETVDFRVKTTSSNYEFVIYRLGWYGGAGGREVARFIPSVPLPQVQPAHYADPVTGLADAGNWAISGSWSVPANAVSGVYTAVLNRLDTPGVANRILFVVRNDGATSDIYLQTSDATYTAYNQWGGNSLYVGPTSSYGRAVKVSYNRPQYTAELENHFFYGEYPLVRWLERNGYDVTYCGALDTETRGAEILKRKIFVSSGHDEYWGSGMRTNVEAARDAGVHCIFMTGNEIFWKVRWENSVDGTDTPNRTMVCYKETLDGARIDPTSAWTGTWRDARFTSFPNGANPENSLTGTLFKAINPSPDPDFAIEVPYAYSKLRLWRNTAVANLTAGQKVTLAASTLGYEWDTDVDNGRRPAGLIRLSQTTQTANQVLQDEGAIYATAPLTHYLTMYRAPSGALVWGTGTVQWSWGLDENHWYDPDQDIPQDVTMQQATLNVLADMGAQPATRQSNLVAAAASTDTVAPTSAVSAPAANANVTVGVALTVTGTATDTGGGVVAAVEVSTDGGTTWHLATGTASWSYTFTPLTLGSSTVKVRAIDDSCNLQVTPTTLFLNGVARAYPVTLFPTAFTPTAPALADGSAVELGVKFRSSIDGFVTGVRFYKGTGNTGTHVGSLWTRDGLNLGSVTFASESASGWQSASFARPIAISANTTYVVSYFAPAGHYAGDVSYFASAFDLYPLRALADGEDGPNGIYGSGAGFPTQTFKGTNYWVDVAFDVDDHVAPTVADVTPAAGLEAVGVSAPVKAVFSEAMDAATIVVEVRNPANALVAGTTAYDSPTRTATFTPGSPMANLTAHTLKVTGKDKLGNPMAAAFTSTFTTVSTVGGLPTPLWDTSIAPGTAAQNDGTALEVGVKFVADRDGEIKGIRFFKGAGNGGTHVAHLWNAGGTLLGTANFTAESASGWQQANFPAPVAVTRNTVYVASYYAPVGHYAADGAFFASAAVDRGPLHGLQNGTSGGNGVYHVGAGGGFPTDTFNSTNYWVDVLYNVPPDHTGPVVASTNPGKGLLAVGPSVPVQATFSEAVNPATISFTVTGAAAVAGSVSYDATSLTASFTPGAALALATTYTARVSASDTAGNAMSAPFSWTFTTATAVGATPATLWDTSAVPASPNFTDSAAVELGLKFTVEKAGDIIGLRFYKGSASTASTHTGTLWASDGTQLKSVAYSAETLSGWQQVLFDTPVSVQPSTVYLASYLAPPGGYSVTPNGLASSVSRSPLTAVAGGGCFHYGSGGFPDTASTANYWVDVIYLPSSPPGVTAVTPTASATAVPVTAAVTATFSESVQAASVKMELRDPGNNLVNAATAYDANAKKATLTPAARLSFNTLYTAKVTAALDLGGTPMAAPFTWTFTTDAVVSPAVVPLTSGSTVGLEPFSSPGSRLRHQNFAVIVSPTPTSDDQARIDSSYIVRPGISNSAWVSFESVNHPGYFLRQSNQALALVKKDLLGIFTGYNADATFKPVTGLNGANTSFESASLAGYYLKVVAGAVKLVRNDSTAQGKNDSTWVVRPGFDPFQLDARYSIEAGNLAANYVDHDGFGVVLTNIPANSFNLLDKMSATYYARKGLANGACVSFESVDYPGHFLRRVGATVQLAKRDTSTAYANDATWCPDIGLTGSALALRAYGTTDTYLRHNARALAVAQFDGSSGMRADATFNARTGLV